MNLHLLRFPLIANDVFKTSLAIILVVISLCDAAARDPRPNIVLIIADDMAWDDCGAYGHPRIRTPNLDRLAADGMLFRNAFLTTSSCSPSRSSIITGLYPHQTDAQQLHWELPREKVTFVEKLKAAGYWTAQAGKWHLGNQVKDRFDFLAGESTDALQRSFGQLPPDDKSGAHLWVPLLEHRPKNQPFFLWLAADDPHRGYQEEIIAHPHTLDDVILPPYVPDAASVRKDFTMYYDEISRLDDYVGKVVETLDRQGVSDNTLILFITDNGRPFPRDKTTLYDSGIKTPWIVKWPSVVKAGTHCDALVSTVDIATTFLGLADAEPLVQSPGVDWRVLLTDPDAKIRDRVYGQAHWHDHENFVRAVRDERFKYIKTFFNDLPLTPPADALNGGAFGEIRRLRETGQLEKDLEALYFSARPMEALYDLENDPYELHNLAEDPDHQETLQRLRNDLGAFMARFDDRVPRLRTPDEFDRVTGARLPNNRLPRASKKEIFGDCDCLYLDAGH